MIRNLFEAKYYATYEVAGVIDTILSDPFKYLYELEEFFLPEQHVSFIYAFPKPSRFYRFIEFVLGMIWLPAFQSVDLESLKARDHLNSSSGHRQLPINHALRYYDIEHYSFEEFLKSNGKTFLTSDEDDPCLYHEELFLTGHTEALITRISDEVFYLMFLNREALQQFNTMVAKFVISTLDAEDFDNDTRGYLNKRKSGVLKRKHLPKWVKRAVYYRDQGRCVLCNKDISGKLRPESEEHFDHIIPLSSGGMNDVTNIQLVCITCNLSKGARNSSTSNQYGAWF